MLTFIQNIFGKSKERAKAPPSTTQLAPEPTPLISTIEVAHLKLSSILARLPDELKALVLTAPDDAVTVALPIATIVKQLPSGSVKVSLATLHRQAPAGIFGALPPGDKRMVEVPLAEIFRHIKPTTFKRRNDQRASEGLESKFNLFGDSLNPFQIAPTTPDDVPAPEVAAPAPAAVPEMEMPALETAAEAAEEPAFVPAPLAPPTAQRMIAPPLDFFGSKPGKPAPVAPEAPEMPKLELPKLETPKPAAPVVPPTLTLAPAEGPSIAVPLEALAASWPEQIRNEVVALNGSARVSLPKSDVTAGLARGRVTFTWGQIRGWIQPMPEAPTSADEATELTLPLKVVAPLFLAAAKKPQAAAKPAAFETDIPALFNSAHAPVPETPPAPEPEVAVTAVVESPVVEAEPEPEEPARVPETVGELFGQPEKKDWTPTEIVANLAKLPGVVGAVVALQEGLLVAHSLPADVKSEVIAAFLPQIFGRLNQYAHEMKLGEVDDLLFTTHGAHCQIYRIGFLYFAVLGRPGESLPWTELRIVADELARQSNQS